jgi:hypothetical protein
MCLLGLMHFANGVGALPLSHQRLCQDEAALVPVLTVQCRLDRNLMLPCLFNHALNAPRSCVIVLGIVIVLDKSAL